MSTLLRHERSWRLKTLRDCLMERVKTSRSFLRTSTGSSKRSESDIVSWDQRRRYRSLNYQGQNFGRADKLPQPGSNFHRGLAKIAWIWSCFQRELGGGTSSSLTKPPTRRIYRRAGLGGGKSLILLITRLIIDLPRCRLRSSLEEDQREGILQSKRS